VVRGAPSTWDFVLPIAEWARRSLQPEIERLLTDAELIGRVGLCAGTVRTLWASYVAGKPGLHGPGWG